MDLTDSKPKEGVVFAVCIFAVGEDGTKYLVDHRHAENMGECIKKRREAVNKYKDPKHRELMGGTRFMFMCDKVRAEVEILEDGTWHINKILGRYEPAYEREKNVITNDQRTKNPIAKILRYFKPQTYRNKKAYTRKEKNSRGKTHWINLGDW